MSATEEAHMTFFNYLQNNLRWQFVQNPFGALVCPPTSKATLYGELDKLAEKYFPQNAKIEVKGETIRIRQCYVTVAIFNLVKRCPLAEL